MSTLLEPELRLTPQKEKAARYIAEGMSQTRVAEDLHLTKQTINRWCNHDEEFMNRVVELRVGANKEVLDDFVETLPEAKKVIIDIAKNGGSATQLKAATLILEYVTKNGVSSTSSKKGKEEKTEESNVISDELDADAILSRFE